MRSHPSNTFDVCILLCKNNTTGMRQAGGRNSSEASRSCNRIPRMRGCPRAFEIRCSRCSLRPELLRRPRDVEVAWPKNLTVLSLQLDRSHWTNTVWGAKPPSDQRNPLARRGTVVRSAQAGRPPVSTVDASKRVLSEIWVAKPPPDKRHPRATRDSVFRSALAWGSPIRSENLVEGSHRARPATVHTVLERVDASRRCGAQDGAATAEPRAAVREVREHRHEDAWCLGPPRKQGGSTSVGESANTNPWCTVPPCKAGGRTPLGENDQKKSINYEQPPRSEWALDSSASSHATDAHRPPSASSGAVEAAGAEPA